MNLETQIINQLFHNERYGRYILPYLSKEYFTDTGNRTLFEHIEAFSAKYQNLPTTVAIQIELEGSDLPDGVYKAAADALDMNRQGQPVDYDWMVDQTEKYCKDQAVANAIREGIKILADPKRNNTEIEGIMQKALSISFDSNLGMDVLEDADRQYEMTHAETSKIPFMIDAFNRATDGGAEAKTLNVIMAGCVDPTTPVIIRYKYDEIVRTVEVPIKRIGQLLEEDITVEIYSPDGFVPVSEYVEKGLYQQYVLRLEDQRLVRCNEDHLFKTHLYGWMTASEIAGLTEGTIEITFETSKGLMKGQVLKTDFMVDIVDVVIDHPEHRYYANGVESHNTNVGKSLILCHLAGDYLLQGKNVLYVTFEMAEEKIAARVYANILNVKLDDHKAMPKAWFLEAVERVKKRTTGKLMVKEYPSSGAHVGHIRHHVQELKLKKGFKPDVIMFDYIGIMASSRQKSAVARHVYLQSVAQEIRGLMQELEAIGWSAVQTNRAGFDNSDPTVTDIAEAWGIPMEADWYIVVSQGEDMEKLGQFLVRQEKSRYSDKDKMRKFVIGVDKAKQRIYDVDTNAQLMIEDVNEEEDSSDKFKRFM
jgi:KaiC/GvpD/RAD55 family RecA-like ATPase